MTLKKDSEKLAFLRRAVDEAGAALATINTIATLKIERHLAEALLVTTTDEEAKDDAHMKRYTEQGKTILSLIDEELRRLRAI